MGRRSKKAIEVPFKEPDRIIADEARHIRKTRSPIAFHEQCTSPRKRRQFTHRTDVINGDIQHAKERSRTFREKYERQNWHVNVTPVFS